VPSRLSRPARLEGVHWQVLLIVQKKRKGKEASARERGFVWVARKRKCEREGGDETDPKKIKSVELKSRGEGDV